MNRSYSKIRHIQEANERLEKRMLTEQSLPGGLWGQETEKVTNSMIDIYRKNPHEINTVLGITALFIPVVGPFISSGIGLLDASMYAKEGKWKEAGVVAFFSLLPGIGAAASKIPGIKQLGVKGMAALANKVLSKTPLTQIEAGIVKGIANNAGAIEQEASAVIKNMASKGVGKAVDVSKKKALSHIAKHGIEKGVEHAALHSVAHGV
jgi:hypothetical protein